MTSLTVWDLKEILLKILDNRTLIFYFVLYCKKLIFCIKSYVKNFETFKLKKYRTPKSLFIYIKKKILRHTNFLFQAPINSLQSKLSGLTCVYIIFWRILKIITTETVVMVAKPKFDSSAINFFIFRLCYSLSDGWTCILRWYTLWHMIFRWPLRFFSDFVSQHHLFLVLFTFHIIFFAHSVRL